MGKGNKRSLVTNFNGVKAFKISLRYDAAQVTCQNSFKPVVNAELVRQFSMSIYNKWGQRIFVISCPMHRYKYLETALS